MSEALQAYEKRLAELVKHHEARAEKVVPELYKLLRKANQEPKEARATLEHDLTRLWKLDTIQRHLPNECKDSKQQEHRKKRTEKEQSEKATMVGTHPTDKPLISVAAGGEEELTIANSNKPEVVSEPYSAGAKKDRTATYTERQTALIADLKSKLFTEQTLNNQLRDKIASMEKSGYAQDNTQELLDAQIRIKELEQPFTCKLRVDVGRHRPMAEVRVRPAKKEVVSITFPEEELPSEMFA